MTSGPLVIVGDSLFAEVAFEYFSHDSPYEPVAFAVEAQYRTRDEFHGLPVVDYETLTETHPPGEHAVYVAMVYTQLNRLRTRLAQASKAAGYDLASYVSSRASVWRNVQFGEHVFIFEGNVLEAFVQIGDNVVMWTSNIAAHHASIRDNVFVSGGVVIAGSVVIGENSFLGVNSTVVNDIVVGRDNWIGPGVCVTHDTQPGSAFRPARSELRDVTSFQLLGLDES